LLLAFRLSSKHHIKAVKTNAVFCASDNVAEDNLMARRALLMTVFLAFVSGLGANGQTQVPTITDFCPYKNHQKDLACLIPDLTRTAGTNLATFNTTLAQVLGQLPIAVPISGLALTFDQTLHIYVVSSSDNLGSILTERGGTIGRHKLFLGFSYERFVFQSIDGTALKNLPTVFTVGGAPGGKQTTYGSADNSIGANINQYTAVAAFGLTNRIDLSLTLPIERVSVSASQRNYVQYSSSGNPNGVAPPVSVPGSASGPGDLLLNVKGTIWKGEKFSLASGLEVRFPTGDEFNLLGSGAYGLNPYVVFSRQGRFTPHVNVGYQWNGFSDLYVNPCITAPPGPLSCQPKSTSSPNYSLPTLRLPSDLNYSAGVDIGIVKRLTFVADLVGQHYFNALRVTPAAPASQVIPNLPPNAVLRSQPTVGITNGSYDNDNLGLGFKVNPVGHLLLYANVLIRLNQGGLRSDFVPLVGVSYKFGKF
jgi:hypothetical protein